MQLQRTMNTNPDLGCIKFVADIATKGWRCISALRQAHGSGPDPIELSGSIQCQADSNCAITIIVVVFNQCIPNLTMTCLQNLCAFLSPAEAAI